MAQVGPSDEVVAQSKCFLDAEKEAFDEYNANNGTSYTPAAVLTPETLYTIWPRFDELRNACPDVYHFRRIEKPSEELLTIDLTSYYSSNPPSSP